MELRFDFAEDDSTTGFRLEEFELYNWGTYDKQVISLNLNKQNALLTGDIGSGKSTIVDALTTLLVPHQKITFNKAAGAESKERTLKSYILGEYKSAQDENLGNAKAIALRDGSSFTVLLARFLNDGYDESYTVAQFFYIANNQVQKFFITSKGELGIKKDFINSSFKDIRSLKKTLRSLPHTQVHESFKEYSKDFRRSMGNINDQALNLFYQTVSLKSIGNLTTFVREHMLESSEIDTKIDELCKNFSELSHAHTLVLKAQKQIDMLTPLEKEAKVHEKLQQMKSQSEEMRDALGIYFASFKKELVEKKIEELEIELQKTQSAKKQTDILLAEKRESELSLNTELKLNGGDRIKQLQELKKQSEKELREKKEAHSSYNMLTKELSLPTVSNEHRFLKNSLDAQESLEEQEEQSAKLQNSIVMDSSTLQRYSEQSIDLSNEIEFLEKNRSNIPKKVSEIRDAMAEKLGVDIEELPFVGELVKVKDIEWQGAIERVLHNFSLSLLVDEKIYERVSEYVNATHLGGKLVYLKVLPKKVQGEFFERAKNSLLQKIEVKADSYFYDALWSMLQERFDTPCVANMEEFRKFKKALTKSGQFKSSLSRHEKDDRFDINDKRRWTLGWDNAQKLASYKSEAKKLSEKIEYINIEIQKAKSELDALQLRRDKLRDLLNYKEFAKIDWYSIAKREEQIDEELMALEKSSDILQTLGAKLLSVKAEIANLMPKSDELSKKVGAFESKLESHKEELKALMSDEELAFELREALDILYKELVEEALNLNNITAKERVLRTQLQQEIDRSAKRIESSVQKILTAMTQYKNKFVVESQEFDASIASLKEYRAKLSELKRDDLPKFEKRFRELFKEKTIQKTAMIQAELEHHAKEIESKISKINNSLQDIEYNSGTYITLIAEPSNIKEIREFKQDLKSAISYAIGDDNSYDEGKFLQIKKIIDRFNGREGHSDVDKKWRNLVTDVRNWFNFSASERYTSDGSEKEYYAHSGGKSGGQKEKLAYTVLASSLAFQFGLEYNEVRSRSFRFVMIDEAFGKGSDESTKYALRLFEKLNLQLLVITPKTKINVIAPFVKSVHFVHNQDGMHSSLLSMSIEEYQKNARG